MIKTILRPNCAGANSTKTMPVWQSIEGTQVVPNLHTKLCQNCSPLHRIQPVVSQAYENGTDCPIQDKMSRSGSTPIQKDRQLFCYTFLDLKYSQSLVEQHGR